MHVSTSEENGVTNQKSQFIRDWFEAPRETVKTIVKESHNLELVCLKKKKEWPSGDFWFGSLAMRFRTTGRVVHHENTRR